jgi:8-oxo-dGTP pyrophosphatase MutT (NUDIX family)
VTQARPPLTPESELTPRTPLTLAAGDPELAPTPHLSRARATVSACEPPDDQQVTVQTQMLDFIDAHPDALARSCADGHITGSAVVVDADGARVLLLFHRKLQRWLQPGGHVDGDANLAAAALREATEETGIAGLLVVVPPVDLDIHKVRPPGEQAHLHLDVRYVVLAPPGAVEQGNHESEALRWVDPDHVDGLALDDGTIRLIRRGLAIARNLRTRSDTAERPGPGTWRRPGPEPRG